MFGFEIFGFRNLKNFRVRVIRVFENLPKTRQVFGFMSFTEKFSQNFTKIHHFLPKFFNISGRIASSFNFSSFFRIPVLQSQKIVFFSGSGLGILPKLVGFWGSGKLDQALVFTCFTIFHFFFSGFFVIFSARWILPDDVTGNVMVVEGPSLVCHSEMQKSLL